MAVRFNLSKNETGIEREKKNKAQKRAKARAGPRSAVRFKPDVHPRRVSKK